MPLAAVPAVGGNARRVVSLKSRREANKPRTSEPSVTDMPEVPTAATKMTTSESLSATASEPQAPVKARQFSSKHTGLSRCIWQMGNIARSSTDALQPPASLAMPGADASLVRSNTMQSSSSIRMVAKQVSVVRDVFLTVTRLTACKCALRNQAL